MNVRHCGDYFSLAIEATVSGSAEMIPSFAKESFMYLIAEESGSFGAYVALFVFVVMSSAFIAFLIWNQKQERDREREKQRIANLPTNKRRRLELDLARTQKEAAHLQEQVEEILALESKGQPS